MRNGTPGLMSIGKMTPMEFAQIVGIGVAYFIAHQLAFFFPDSEKVIMAVWPAGGIGLAAFLLSPRRLWPALIATFYSAGISADVLFAHRPFFGGVGYMTANMVESLGCAWLILRWGGSDIRFDRIKEVIPLIVGTVVVNAASSCIGAGTAMLVQLASFGVAWFSWYVADGLGILLITPVIVTWLRPETGLPPVKFRLVESLVFLVIWCTSIGLLLKPDVVNDSQALRPYILFALLVWPAIRLGQRMVAASLIILAVMMIGGLLRHHGFFPASGYGDSMQLLQTQIFLGCAGITAFVLAAVYHESRIAEFASREGQERLRVLGDNLPNGMIYQVLRELDGRMRFSYVSAASTRLNGVASEEVLKDSSKLYGLIAVEDRERLAAAEEKSFVNLSVLSETVRYRMADGQIKWMHLASSPRRLPDGRTIWDGIQLDITDRKDGETALLESEKRYRNLFAQAGEGIIIMTPTGVIAEANEAFAVMHGYTTGELCKKNIEQLDVQGKDLWNAISDEIRSIRSGKIVNFEVAHLHKDGHRFPVSVTASLINIGGEPFYLSIHRDISMLRQAEKERERYEHQLNQAQKLDSLGVLAGGIAHDFNNLLGGIFGYIDMASEATSEKKVAHNLSKALGTIDRARALTSQLLTFAKGGAPVRENGALFPLVRETAQFALSGSSVSCSYSVADDLWTCNFDKNQIGQVIDNIVINAQQAMSDGGTIAVAAENVTLCKKEHPSLPPGQYVRISITDQGIGMPEEILPRIFEPFYSTKPKGHGLGLATCYSIVNRHGGCIDVASEPGKGSTFHVFLPAVTDVVGEGTIAPAVRHSGTGIILVMDDEEVIRETVGDMLESFGYDVVCKEEGRSAIDFFRSETDVGRTLKAMIFDLTVPGGMGGNEAIGQIRSIDNDIPVFVASGYAQSPVMADPATYGFTDSISKPFKRAELARMLEKYLGVVKSG